jgi:maleylpyruvate isomerase
VRQVTDPVLASSELDLVTSPPAPADLLAMVTASTARLLEAAHGLTDEQARAASRLPGWTRGHVLTHLARNADGLANLLTWARTGVVTPMYGSQQERDDDIEAGEGRTAAELTADLAASAAAFAAAGADIPGPAWATEVRGIRGDSHPAWYTLWRRLQEVEIHHVDLGLDYGPADWPAEFAATSLRGISGQFNRPGCPAARLLAADSGAQYAIGPEPAAGQRPGPAVTGPTRQLLAWLIGRSQGEELTAQPAGPLPDVPAW